MSKLTERAPELAARIQTAMDEGKDIDEAEVVKGRGKKKRRREYRNTVPYTDEEALKVALKALKPTSLNSHSLPNSCTGTWSRQQLASRDVPAFLQRKGRHFQYSQEPTV